MARTHTPQTNRPAAQHASIEHVARRQHPPPARGRVAAAVLRSHGHPQAVPGGRLRRAAPACRCSWSLVEHTGGGGETARGRRRRCTRPPRAKPVPGDEIPNARRRGRWCRRRRSSERYFPGGGPWDRVRRARVGPGPVWGHRGPIPRRPRPPGSSKSALLGEPVHRVRFNHKYCLVGVKKHPAGAFEGSRRVYRCCGELF